MNIKTLTRPTNFAQEILKDIIHKGDVVVDATMGNGHDTLFLANMVGEDGRVFSFDIQDLAIENTKRLLQENKIENVCLIQDGHENMDQYIKEEVCAIIFNLGYLPKGDHEIVTKAHTTISALQKSLTLLKKEGLTIMVIYPGHEEGEVEKERILKFTKNLDSTTYHVFEISYTNQNKKPPMILGIIKK
ncbi:class I SAM-dependent methyltransferase [Inediibacterium massiliense]|uniref:class I SAM-dependent methyltransferase n=1 Tax=Inediibacterium massiliense TaxID=1658111 RepID=UPI0006B4EE53|nr:class I SAM-dependent methyltransferase [Inediibacterium massiliense]